MRVLLYSADARSASVFSKLISRQFDLSSAFDRDTFDVFLAGYDFDLIIMYAGDYRKKLIPVIRDLNHQKSTIPILLVGELESSDFIVEALDAGADDYAPVPIDLTVLYAKARTLVRRPLSLASSTIQIGNLRLDLRSKEVFMGANQIVLSPTEYEILERLCLNAGKNVPLDTLYRSMNERSMGTSTTLMRVHIYNLRRKIGEYSKNGPYIVNQPAAGYKITHDSIAAV